jgi:hypothetical protein
MDTTSIATIIDFEVYLLMTMKIRTMNEREVKLFEAKLAEHGLSFDSAERVYERVAKAVGDNEATRFENIKHILGIASQSSTSLKYSSILWPGFDFNATAGEGGLLESARYWHIRRDSRSVDSPTELTIWSMDITEFAEHFGPMTGGRQWPLFDKLLPAHEEYEFAWNGERYGAGFSWGLFLFSSKLWE